MFFETQKEGLMRDIEQYGRRSACMHTESTTMTFDFSLFADRLDHLFA